VGEDVTANVQFIDDIPKVITPLPLAGGAGGGPEAAQGAPPPPPPPPHPAPQEDG
jgi:DNA ligase (NAD+)